MKAFLIFIYLIPLFVFGQKTYVPDDNFELALLALGYDFWPLDDSVSTTNISNVESLEIRTKGINSLIGLENFTALENLDVSGNVLQTINLASNSYLKILRADSCNLNQIDLSANLLLENVFLDTNNLSYLDLSQNLNLIEISSASNNLSFVNFGSINKLKNINFSSNNLVAINLLNFDSIENLNCSNNHFQSFNLQNFTNLKILNLSQNQLDSINLNTNHVLVNLNVSSNFLQKINLQLCPNLQYLNIDSNNIKEIDFSLNNALVEINCSYNKIENLEIKNKPSLHYISCVFNNMQIFEIENCLQLENIYCHNNKIKKLDLSSVEALKNFEANNSGLTELKIKNGQNTNLNFINIKNNPVLYCVEVNDPIWCRNNWIEKDLHTIYTQSCIIEPGQTYIPDINFEYLLWLKNLDTGPFDHKVKTSNIDTITYLRAVNRSIKTMQGIEDFASLRVLDCAFNEIENLYLNQNQNLESLLCDFNQITSLYLNSNFKLKELWCNNNNLSTLQIQNGNNRSFAASDTFSQGYSSNTFLAHNNPNLECIEVDDPYWSNVYWQSIDTQSFFTSFCPSDDRFTHIPDINFETKLIALGLDEFPTDKAVKTSNIDTLKKLDVSFLAIKSLSGIEDFAALEELNCSRNEINFLILSKNENLIFLNCESNQLNFLDLKNGNNSNFIHYNSLQNPSLSCIFVDNKIWSQQNWSFLDIESSFMEDIQDCAKKYEASLPFKNEIYPNPTNSTLFVISNEETPFSFYAINGKNVLSGKLQIGIQELYLESLESGVYYFTTINEGKRNIQKIVKY